jgi:hypothetical protein
LMCFVLARIAYDKARPAGKAAGVRAGLDREDEVY